MKSQVPNGHPVMTDERRDNTRKRTLKSAKIVFGDFRYTYDCVIRDVSGTGLRVRCAHADEVPDEFYLFDQSEGSLQKGTAAWRRNGEIGIHLIGERISIHESNDPRHARFKFL